MTVRVKDIDALLPQTQCGECGFPGCLPYAEALSQCAAPPDRCPPGGLATLEALGQLLHIDVQPYKIAAAANTRAPSVAVIKEEECIGCTKCIQACPVDAIVGAGKWMHVVVTHECTGCGLCVEPCPVDCIELLPQEKASYDRDLARQRFENRRVRELREERERQQLYWDKRRAAADNQQNIKARQDYILQAMNRVKAKKSHE